MQLSNYRCPITANCPITLSDYNFADKLEQNTAVYAPITFAKVDFILGPFVQSQIKCLIVENKCNCVKFKNKRIKFIDLDFCYVLLTVMEVCNLIS